MSTKNSDDLISTNAALVFMIPITALVIFGFYIIIDQHQTIASLKTQISTIQHPKPIIKYVLVKKVADDEDADKKNSLKTLDPELDKTIKLINQDAIKSIEQAHQILSKLSNKETLALDETLIKLVNLNE